MHPTNAQPPPTPPTPVLDYTTLPRDAHHDGLDLLESPDGTLTLVAPPPPPWRNIPAVIAASLASATFLLAAALLLYSYTPGLGLPAWIALSLFASLTLAHHALSRVLNRNLPTTLTVSPDTVTLTRPRLGRHHTRHFPRSRVRGFPLRRLGLGPTLRPLARLSLAPRYRLSLPICTAPHAALVPIRTRLQLALRPPPSAFPVLPPAPPRQQ